MSHYNLALLGFGNVGKAFARLLLNKREELQARYNLTYSVTGIATGRHGAVIDRDGLDLTRVLEEGLGAVMPPGGGNGASKDAPFSQPGSLQNPPAEAFAFLRNCGADVLFENTPVNYENGQPAVDHIRTALELGMHAVTANKGPVVHAYRALTNLAEARGLKFYFESAVMDGAPIFSLFREALPGARLLRLRGVLNSTTNLILTRMEGGESFDDAVRYAQSIGIAETDPSGDIDGWDASVKVAALATVLMGTPLKPSQVDRQGIRGVTLEEIRRAREAGRRWKLVCSAERVGEGVSARVAPEMVAPDSPLYHVEGTSSTITFETDVLGPLSVVESDPGPHTTAYGLLADFLNIARR
jgi:homoserine dehydrogenase